MDSYTGHQVVEKRSARWCRRRLHRPRDGGELRPSRLEVTLVEKLNQVMPPLDPEMARLVERYLVKHA